MLYIFLTKRIRDNKSRSHRYEYDAYGNHKVYDSSGNENKNANFIGNINPIRYRSYYYDVETGLYYLQTRYYDPEFGRFISPDSTKYLDPTTINGLNLYSYCLNNPVMYSDPSGHFVFSAFLLSTLAGALVSFAFEYIPDVIENFRDGFDWSDFNTFEEHGTEYIIAALKGAVTGAAFGIGTGFGITAFKAGTAIKASTGLIAFASTAAGSFAAGLGIYTLETKVFGLKEFNYKDFWKAGTIMGVKGSLNFSMGLLMANQGFNSGPFIKSWITRLYLKNGLMFPVDLIVTALLEELW